MREVRCTVELIANVGRRGPSVGPFGDLGEEDDEQTVAAAATGAGVEADQLHPLVEPQLGQAWHEPARIIWTPHCMHMGASL